MNHSFIGYELVLILNKLIYILNYKNFVRLVNPYNSTICMSFIVGLYPKKPKTSGSAEKAY